jgi:hypothetical protein
MSPLLIVTARAIKTMCMPCVSKEQRLKSAHICIFISLAQSAVPIDNFYGAARPYFRTNTSCTWAPTAPGRLYFARYWAFVAAHLIARCLQAKRNYTKKTRSESRGWFAANFHARQRRKPLMMDFCSIGRACVFLCCDRRQEVNYKDKFCIRQTIDTSEKIHNSCRSFV